MLLSSILLSSEVVSFSEIHSVRAGLVRVMPSGAFFTFMGHDLNLSDFVGALVISIC